ncbi:phosphoenolpyruvate phosphomutase-domain-containing protein [Biscogniauxia mediterranea]|nr:phosphoenolpyruvate phosphomutase-domain-containing protein [Biscogniauxia mediterranea]
MGFIQNKPVLMPSSSSVRTLLAQTNGRISLCETHDRTSTEIIRNAVGKDGQTFDGIWYSGLCQTTYLGIPDTEMISPLQRASLLALNGDLKRTTNSRSLCAAFDADSGGDMADIPALVALLSLVGVGMVIIEDKAISAPGQKVNSLEDASGSQKQANMHEFADVIRAFKAASGDRDIMITARIESFTCRISKADPIEERKSCEHALQDALLRANTYREAGVDAIMIHSKSKSPDEVLQFLREYRAVDPHTPLVVVPTAYSKTTKETLYNAGANVIIYANHLMRAKISAVSSISDKILAQNPELFADDEEARACIEARNYGCLLRKLRERSYWGEESKEARMYRIVAETCAFDNIQATVNDLLEGELAGCEADTRIISVKELLKINARQVAPVAGLVSWMPYR